MTELDYILTKAEQTSALQVRVKELEDALRPFARVGSLLPPQRMAGVTVRPEWLRVAHQLLQENQRGANPTDHPPADGQGVVELRRVH